MHKDTGRSYRQLILKGLFENTSVQRTAIFINADQSTDIKHTPGA